jgi:hypothetical protein
MSRSKISVLLILTAFFILLSPENTSAWYDETHLAIAKAAGYRKWYNATGADMAKIKAENIERHNHYANNPVGTVVTKRMVLSQVDKYNQIEVKGHLYGAIVASLRDYLEDKQEGKYREYHLAYCAHYVGDMSQPLHNTAYNTFNQKHLEKIKPYRITIDSEETFAKEIGRIANLSMKLGYKIEAENRLLTKEEAYTQISHSVSLLRAILKYVGKKITTE